MPIRTYDPAAIIIIFNGILISGYADGTFVKAERNQDSFTLLVGADGEGVRTRSNDKSGKVVITVISAMPVNDLLAAKANLDEALGTGAGVLQITDVLGNTLVHASEAWIAKAPDIEFGKEAGKTEWTIACLAMDTFAGGEFQI